MSDYYIDEKTGIKVERLPTVGKPLRLKTRKQGGGVGYFRPGVSDAKKLKAIAKVLRSKD